MEKCDCGFVPKKEDLFCRGCGKNLNDDDSFLCECGAEVEENDNFCHACGVKFDGIEEEDEFLEETGNIEETKCNTCGNPY